uniref:P-type domain-containing protein n=1 Tax=Timema bartmani TaxID=61472 RepID=A0A7R9HYT8_9NEOP|nr:unnamed protein product [Timema bartmani]
MGFLINCIMVTLAVWVLGATSTPTNIHLSNATLRLGLDPPATEQCTAVENSMRFDCYSETGANEDLCHARGCCWIPASLSGHKLGLATPYCFYPANYAGLYGGYTISDVSDTDSGKSATLVRTTASFIGNDVMTIKIDAKFETGNRLHIKVYDPANERWEPPLPVMPTVNSKASDTDYEVVFDETKVGFQVVRSSTSEVITADQDSNPDLPVIRTAWGGGGDNEPPKHLLLVRTVNCEKVSMPLTYVLTNSFNTQDLGAFIFADQFIQMMTYLPSKYIYGLGEHRASFPLSTEWSQFTMWNRDQSPGENTNLYGTHPFYLAMEASGNAHGVFLFNSNAMDVLLNPGPTLTYRTVGGILDMYFLMGPTPADVVKQYTELIGRPFIPPYWGLGFHLCRYGYADLADTKAAMTRTQDAGIPLDTQWNDLDYMENQNDFTYDTDKFAGLPDFVDELHQARNLSRHYLYYNISVHSGSEASGTYPPYDRGVELGVFIKDSSGAPFLGKVWNPVSTVWPDFTHPDSITYWKEMLQSMYDLFEFDGAWILARTLTIGTWNLRGGWDEENELLGVVIGIKIDSLCVCGTKRKGEDVLMTSDGSLTLWSGVDEWNHEEVSTKVTCRQDMNEPSNFLDGSSTGCADNSLNNPPFTPGVSGGSLISKTICMDADQYAGKHYNLHNMYAFTEAIVTSTVLSEIRQKRPFVISRSSFVGLGSYVGHWSGDISSSWGDMAWTIPGEGLRRDHEELTHDIYYLSIHTTVHFISIELLSMSLFGIPLMGADICGFNGNTNNALCQRWMELGAFYPFSRNHNGKGYTAQDPASLGDDVVTASKKALLVRYSLLPYLYTLFYKAHLDGSTVVTPIFFEFPSDESTYSIDTAFMWGSGLLIAPVLTEATTQVDIYLPLAQWYDFYTGALLTSGGADTTLDAPLDTIPLLVRGGHILPMQEPGMTTTASRKNNFQLMVASDESGSASGELYWDDGDTLGTYEAGAYTLVSFSLQSSQLTGTPKKTGYTGENMNLGTITVLGVSSASSVTANGGSATFAYDGTNKVLTITGLSISLSDSFTVTWS